MPKTGPEWIHSPEKHAFELGILAVTAPAIVPVTLAARGATRLIGGSRSIIAVERALTPGGERFSVPKLSASNSSTAWNRWLSKLMLDELPQVKLIIEREMVLFGPRGEDPDHTERLFHAIDDEDLRSEWQMVRSVQKGGIFSSYAIRSHAGNLEGLTESARFGKNKLRRNAYTRAHHDMEDYRNAGPLYDSGLLLSGFRMISGNYKKLLA
jgi:lipopolysaccharide/colanic/teichoic acid biosynthesis glycosyltransferase